MRYDAGMRPIFTAVTLAVALAALVAGCSKCDPWWTDGPHACHSGAPVR
jgi:hypothetical protein